MSNKESSSKQPPCVKVHHSLSEHGIAQKLISVATSSDTDHHQVELAQKIGNGWKKERTGLCQSYLEATTSQDAALQADAKLSRILNHVPKDNAPSGSRLLFRFIIASSSGCECSSQLEQRAREEYSRRQDLYDRLLGDAVPEALRSDVDRVKFFNNANPTALADDRAHWDLLHSKESVLHGIPTSIPSLDAKIGGLAGLTLLAGPTAVGKTSLAVELIAQILSHSPDVCVLFLELEVSKARIYHKFLSRESAVPQRMLLSPAGWTADIKAKVQAGRERLQQTVYPRLLVLDRLTNSNATILSADNLYFLVKQLIKTTGTERCLVVLDSFDRMTPAITSGFGKNGCSETYELLEECSDRTRMDVLLTAQRKLKWLFPPDGFPFLVLTRTRKALADDGRLTLPDVRGSVDIVYDMSLVLLMQIVHSLKAPGISSVILDVAKVRDMGETGVIPFDFHFEYSKFTVPTSQAADASRQPSKIAAATPRRAGRK